MTTPQAGTQNINDINRPLSIGDWIITLIVLTIPFVNLIFLLYWSLSSSSNVNRKNFCLAYIILAAIFIALAIVLGFIAIAMGLFAEHAGTVHGSTHGMSGVYG